METGYIVSTVTESHLKAIRRSIEHLNQVNDLPLAHDMLLTLCNQFDRHYQTAGVLFLNEHELTNVWTPLYNSIKTTEQLDIDAKRLIREIHAQLESFSPIKLETDLFDLPQPEQNPV